jgi:DNA-binding response OmpR family regulator
MKELISRIRCLNRKSGGDRSPRSILIIDTLRLNLETKQVSRNQQSLELTQKEFQVLSLLAEEPTKLYSRAQLLTRVWDENYESESNVVEALIARLRKKINQEGEISLIHFKRGCGYSLLENHES